MVVVSSFTAALGPAALADVICLRNRQGLRTLKSSVTVRSFELDHLRNYHADVAV